MAKNTFFSFVRQTKPALKWDPKLSPNRSIFPSLSAILRKKDSVNHKENVCELNQPESLLRNDDPAGPPVQFWRKHLSCCRATPHHREALF